MTLVTSSYTLQFLTVDILVALRCCTTFFVAAGEFIFGGRKLPSLISSISLVALAISSIFVFAVGAKDYFTATSILFGFAYVIALSSDQVVNRLFVVNVQIPTDERVLWMNFLCFFGVVICYIIQSSYNWFNNNEPIALVLGNTTSFFSIQVQMPLIISCILGLGMSYTSWVLRSLLSALFFTVVGCVCKLLSMLINAIFFVHLDIVSMILVFLGVLATTFFEETEVKKKEQSNIESDIVDPVTPPLNKLKLGGISILFVIICILSSYILFNDRFFVTI